MWSRLTKPLDALTDMAADPGVRFLRNDIENEKAFGV